MLATLVRTFAAEGYFAVLYDNTKGLPTSEANAIIETQDGSIWIGSYSGLIHYDGSSFERVDSSSTGIANVASLYSDTKNRLWIGTNDSGIAVKESSSFRIYGRADGLLSLSIRSIAEDASGCIYVATTRGMAYIDQSLNLMRIDEPLINEETIIEIKTGSNDTIYGITRGGDVFTVREKKLTGFYKLKDLGFKTIHSIQPDDAGGIYLGTTGSEIYYGKIEEGFSSMKEISAAPLSYINSIRFIKDSLWVTADNGTGFFKDGKFTIVSDIPMTTSIESVISDYQGNLWFASSQQGIMKLVSSHFTDIFKECHLEGEVVYSTCIHNGRLFIGTKNSGLMVLQDGRPIDDLPARDSTGRQINLVEMLAGCRIRSIIRDSRNRLWFSTYGDNALVLYDRGFVTTFTQEDGLPSNRVRTVCEKPDGSVMVCCTGGLAVIKDNAVSAVYGEDSLSGNTEIMTVSQLKDGSMVAGTDGGGIYIIAPDGTVACAGLEDGLSSDVVLRIKKSPSRDILWIVTSNSIAYMTEDRKITTLRKFPYSNNFDLYENSKNQLWVLSSNGVYAADIEDLLKDREINPAYYGMESGLPCIVTSNSYSELTAGGDLYIAGTTGIAMVNIEESPESTSTFKMSVPFIYADGTKIYPSDDRKFVISSGVRKLTICGYVYNYSLTDPQVAYCLYGLEQNPTTVKKSELMPVSYTNLRGGDYHFVMRIQNPRDQDMAPLDIHIVKKKSAWELKWLRLLLVLLAASVIFSIVRLYIGYRTNSFLKKESAQRQLIREIVGAFAKVIDIKDRYTNGHSFRVAEYTAMLAEELGYSNDTVEKYYNIALLHDIGKIGIPSEILNKPGKLTKKEFCIIKGHSALGYETLKDISIMPELAVGAGAHHERPDGKGYPKGLKGEEIPRVAQIIAVADTFDAMYSDRPYRKRMNFDRAVSIMREVSGMQLASDVVDAFIRLVERGKFRAPDDTGGGSTEDINNIRKRFEDDESTT